MNQVNFLLIPHLQLQTNLYEELVLMIHTTLAVLLGMTLVDLLGKTPLITPTALAHPLDLEHLDQREVPVILFILRMKRVNVQMLV